MEDEEGGKDGGSWELYFVRACMHRAAIFTLLNIL